MIVQVCKYYGATVIGTCSTDEKAGVAKSAGADHIIVYKKEDILERVRQITGGSMVDCVFDGVGKDTFEASRACLKRCGFLLSFGNASGKVDDVDIMKLVPNAIRLMRPSLMQFIQNQEDWENLVGPLMKMVGEGKLKVGSTISYPMERIGEAHADLESGKTVGKLILSI
jgi:NADPH2:quinone reductase